MAIEKIYLELLPGDYRPPAIAAMPDAAIKGEQPDITTYLQWVKLVGAPYGWHLRPRFTDPALVAALAAELKNPDQPILALRIAGDFCGFAWLDWREKPELKIEDIGVIPDKTGGGLGSFFLKHILDDAFAQNTPRVWLTTRNTNHPRLLDFYKRFGFREYKRERIG